MDPQLEAAHGTIPALTGTLAGLGCIVLVAPPGQHPAIKALLHPAVKARLIGPVIVINSEQDLERHRRQLLQAADHLIGQLPQPRRGEQR